MRIYRYIYIYIYYNNEVFESFSQGDFHKITRQIITHVKIVLTQNNSHTHTHTLTQTQMRYFDIPSEMAAILTDYFCIQALRVYS